jgi:hypothetical protein
VNGANGVNNATVIPEFRLANVAITKASLSKILLRALQYKRHSIFVMKTGDHGLYLSSRQSSRRLLSAVSHPTLIYLQARSAKWLSMNYSDTQEPL